MLLLKFRFILLFLRWLLIFVLAQLALVDAGLAAAFDNPPLPPPRPHDLGPPPSPEVLPPSESAKDNVALRMQVLAEMFNTSNHVNVVTVNGVFGTGTYPTNPSPTFRQITAVNDPRTAQFALRFSF